MSENKILGNDLRLELVEEGTDIVVSPTGDLAIVSQDANLGQAILTRLKTRIGELEELGHPTLGSRLYEFVGEPNNPSTRDQIRSVIIDALAEESRVSKIIRVEVEPDDKMLDRLNILVSLIPIASEVPLNMVIPFYLEVA